MFKHKRFSDLERESLTLKDVDESNYWGVNQFTRVKRHPKKAFYWEGYLLIYPPSEYPNYGHYDIYKEFGWMDDTGQLLNEKGIEMESKHKYYPVLIPDELHLSYCNNITELYKKFVPKLVTDESWKNITRPVCIKGKWHVYGCRDGGGGGDGGCLVFEEFKAPFFRGGKTFTNVHSLDNNDPIQSVSNYMTK